MAQLSGFHYIDSYVGDDEPDPLPDRDFSQYAGYWHGFTLIIFDEDNPTAWIRSNYWVPVATEEEERDHGSEP